MNYAGDKGTISIELVHEALKASMEKGLDVSDVKKNQTLILNSCNLQNPEFLQMHTPSSGSILQI